MIYFWMLSSHCTLSPGEDSVGLYFTDTTNKKSQGGVWKNFEFRIQQTDFDTGPDT